ncbi:hypothetical protein EJ06DRAFT_403796 [Trichodelitschia bisporula]|uniref:Secreted protein n=1 Tax=Trichodelitschia bisporula TaxID=703511 RepID=A0A6G1HYC2_9PEZI|nr:hypothetical protein EJ06DRAFT_403796 [Trichodelitschia bisporula]
MSSSSRSIWCLAFVVSFAYMAYPEPMLAVKEKALQYQNCVLTEHGLSDRAGSYIVCRQPRVYQSSCHWYQWLPKAITSQYICASWYRDLMKPHVLSK